MFYLYGQHWRGENYRTQLNSFPPVRDADDSCRGRPLSQGTGVGGTRGHARARGAALGDGG